MANIYTAYTDGSGSALGPGGWGVAIQRSAEVGFSVIEYAGFEPCATNNRMELTAMCVALERVPPHEPLKVYCDSAYVVNGINERWFDKWEKNNWRNSQKKSVANVDLWMRLYDAVLLHPNAQFTHMPGHMADDGEFSDTRGNRRADYLCGEARKYGIAQSLTEPTFWRREYLGAIKPIGSAQVGSQKRSGKTKRGTV